MKSWLVALLAAQVLAPEFAADQERWVAVEESDGDTMFFDRESAVRTGAIVRFRVRVDYAAPSWRGESGALIDHSIDCAAQTITIHRARTFGPRGETLRLIGGAHSRPRPMVGESGEEALYRLACPDGRPLPAPSPAPISTVRN